ncbi:MAG TPA: DNA translocase FtsK 4TM domain-containing protein [Oligoflexia bacterium]|nr:DNA translocase FtsK 4TM domain-containing protein [Oligoflexia bacterium]HMP27743.1 DNA translocase FtsK 4TM domain-containing protein [Oligoflexia bacterium]
MASNEGKRRAPTVSRAKNARRSRSKITFNPSRSELSFELTALILLLFGFGIGLALIWPVLVSSQIVSQGVLASEVESRNIFGLAGVFIADKLGVWFGYSAYFIPTVCLAYAAVFFRRSRLLEAQKFEVVWLKIIGVVIVFLLFTKILAIFDGARGGGSIGVTLADPLQRLLNKRGAAIFSIVLLGWGISYFGIFRFLPFIISAGNFLKESAIFLLLVLPLAVWRFITGLFCVCRGFSRWFFMLGRSDTKVNSPEAAERILSVRPRIRENALKAGTVATTPADNLSREIEVTVARREPSEKGDDGLLFKDGRVRRKDLADTGFSEPSYADYKLPDLNLLIKGEKSAIAEDDRELIEISRLIENKLRDFNIQGRVTHVHPGPVITLYEFEPAAGVKVGRITSLQDDLAMSLKATSIRVIAPIPKRGTVGIEVPNKQRELVRLRDVLECKDFVESESILNVPIGKDTYGDPLVVDIAAMPHLLIAGTTGTGKSVCINSILVSLLYKATPAELGLILIDPKVLELSVYDGIPHLRVPVVTNPRQARAVLAWGVKEMERRYRVMQNFGVRSIDGYNALVRGENSDVPQAKLVVQENPERPEDTVGVVKGNIDVPIGEQVSSGSANEKGASNHGLPAEQLKPLPKILIVIDELADLMLTAGREVEELITRLAQKARAAGIHLIVATQRPSVDVITGLIKANFPARISFRVSSRVDSRTILDGGGADKLLGKGDMLFMIPGNTFIKRVHGAFVSDGEVSAVIKSVKEQAGPKYDPDILKICQKALEESSGEAPEIFRGLDDGYDEGGLDGGANGYDQFYDKAVELVLTKGQASTSMIQRAFRIGYNRAARIVDQMERDGIVGPMDGVRGREVLKSSITESEDQERS